MVTSQETSIPPLQGALIGGLTGAFAGMVIATLLNNRKTRNFIYDKAQILKDELFLTLKQMVRERKLKRTIQRTLQSGAEYEEI